MLLREMSRRGPRLLADILAAASAAAALMIESGLGFSAQAEPEPISRVPELFVREPANFGRQTLDRAWEALAALPTEAGSIAALVIAQLRDLDAGAWILLALLTSALAYGLFNRRRFRDQLEQAICALGRDLPAPINRWFLAGVRTVGAASMPFFAWAWWLFLITMTGYQIPLFLVIERALFAWMIYVLTVDAVREAVLGLVFDLPREYATYVLRAARWLLAYVVVLSVALDTAVELGAAKDVVALCRTSFDLSLIIFLAYFFAHRAVVMKLVPDIPNPLYRKFIGAVGQLYPIVYGFTLGTALLQWAGFSRLAHFLWLRTWVVAGLFVAAIVLHHVLRVSLHAWLMRRAGQSEEAANFYRSAEQLLEYIGLIILFGLALSAVGIGAPLMRLLGTSWFTIGGEAVSPLTVLQALAVLLGFLLSARLVRDYLEYRVYGALNVDPGVSHAINTVIVYAMIIVGVFEACQTVGLSLDTMRLFAGALGIGIGFGLQSIAHNLVGGLILIFTRSLKKGDWITTGETLGMVQEVGIRATRLRTWDNIEHLIPNSQFISGPVVNWTRSNPYARLHVSVGVGYGTEPGKIKEILESVAKTAPNVESSPAPEVWFVGFGDSSINFELLVWVNVKLVERRRVESDLRFRIFSALREAGIEIPFPQRDLHIRSADGLNASPSSQQRRLRAERG
jgi:small-conductance mechanosensitive channel